MNSMMANYLSRHYHLTWFALIVSTVALFGGHMSGGDWAAVVGTTIGTFRIGDVFDTWVKGKNGADKT